MERRPDARWVQRIDWVEEVGSGHARHHIYVTSQAAADAVWYVLTQSLSTVTIEVQRTADKAIIGRWYADGFRGF